MNNSRQVNFVTITKCGSHIIRNSIDQQCQNFNFFHVFTGKQFDKNFEFLYLTRKNTYEFFLSKVYSYYILDRVTEKDNFYTENENNLCYEEQINFFNGQKIFLTKKFITQTLQELELFYKFYSQYPSEHPVLYYEDISVDPENELKKWNFKYYPELSSVKKKKLPYDEVFENPYALESFYYQIENKIKQKYKINF